MGSESAISVAIMHPWLVSQLQNMLHDCNLFIKDLKTAKPWRKPLRKPCQIGKIFRCFITADRKPANGHKGWYNKPTTLKLALVIVGQTFEKQDIVLRGKDTRLTRINETHRSYDALQYPLMFCHGEDGFPTNIPQSNPNMKVPLRSTVSECSFYSKTQSE